MEPQSTPNVPPPPAATPPKRSRIGWWIGGIVAAVVAICLCAGIAGIASDRDGDADADDRTEDTEPADTDTDTDTEEEAEEPDGIGAGVWEVGTDIEPGTYVTTAGDGGIGDHCYWARLSGFGGDVDELIANDNLSSGARGRMTILDGDAGVEFTGNCRWVPATEETAVEAGDEVTAGVWEVGTEIEPGTYTTTASGDGIVDSCYWARLSGFTGEFDELIANDNISGGAQGRVEISDGDAGIKFTGDCIWTKA